MRRTLTTLAVSALSALVVGAGLAGAEPSLRTGRLALAGGEMSCDLATMQAEIRHERGRAAELDRLGEHEAARKARATADATERLMRACVDAEENLSGGRWK
ncbi:hypothetical protein ACGFMM_25480 [Streptomyces sp. NPDC048604]|uniref:hypothetical protein n=1 Tax=Streptomyces sp. NPDC048604 TaxID=3365578 RepID=UPI00371BD183